MSTPRKPKQEEPASKVEQVELPRLVPGGTTKPQKQHSEIMDERFAILHQILNEIREDMDVESSQARKDRIRFEEIHTRCVEKAEQIESTIEDFKIRQIHLSEEHETMTETMNTKIKSLGNSSLISHRRMDKIEQKQEQILRDISAQNIMLNASGHLPKNVSGFNAHSNPDVARYPLLKTLDPKHSFDKLNTNLKGITLKDDELASMENFWDAINSALMMTLKANYLFPEYRSLTSPFSPEDILIPPSGHPYFTEISQAYVQFSRVVRDFILNPNTIKQMNSPQAYRVLLVNKLQRDGFQLL